MAGSRLLLAVVLVLSVAADARTLAAGPFRVETTIFVGDAEEPGSRNLTLFQDGVVYDFLTAPEQVAIFKRSATGDGGHFVLLDRPGQLRTEIRTDQVLALLAELKVWAASHRDPLLRFAAEPRFEEHFDPSQGDLRMESPVMRYHLTTDPPKDGDALAAYGEFSDWYGRLGAILHVGSIPPFPRLAVNRALARHHRLPRTVQLTIPAGKPYRTNEVVMRAEHKIGWRIGRTDQQRIDRVAEELVHFKSVPFDQFHSERWGSEE